MEHLKLCCRVYPWQVDRECYFLHEHSWSASSWKLPHHASDGKVHGVRLICGDQCPFGQAGKGPDGVVRLASGWLTYSACVGGELDIRCCKGSGGNTPRLYQHEHVWLISGRARATERYPLKLVAPVLKGIRAQMQADRNVSMRLMKVGIGPHLDEPESVDGRRR